MAIGTNVAEPNQDRGGVPAPGIYDLDPTLSYFGVSVRHHLVSRVRGQFRTFRGTLTVAEDQSAWGIALDIDAASIDTGDEQRDAHLRSSEFLDAEHHPIMPYRSTRVWPVVAWAPDGRDRWHVEGDLTLHGITRPVDFEVRFEGGAIDHNGEARVGFTARAEIVRDDFGLPANEELQTGDETVDRTVTVEVEIEAVRRT
jgi:polyisoprenoid-binding protein YceI